MLVGDLLQHLHALYIAALTQSHIADNVHVGIPAIRAHGHKRVAQPDHPRLVHVLNDQLKQAFVEPRHAAIGEQPGNHLSALLSGPYGLLYGH